MYAHLADLRAEVRDLEGEARERWLERLGRDWRTAPLAALDSALCAYAQKLSLAPASVTAADIERLRSLGLDDEAIHDAIQVVAFFNYINRVADGVHIDLESDMPPYPDPSGSDAASPLG